MQTIESYEVLTINSTGEVMISLNHDPELMLEDGDALEARFCGLDLQVEAVTPFLIEDLPEDATTFLCEHGRIRLAEFEGQRIARLATLFLTG